MSADAIAEAMRLLRRAGLEHIADGIPGLVATDEPDHPARDAAARQAAARFFSHIPSCRRRAEMLAERLARYRGGADWRDRDRFADCNSYSKEELRHWLWLMLRAVDHASSTERLRKIID